MAQNTGILKQERKVWLTNAIGLLLGLYYVMEFIKYAPKRSPTLPGSVMGHLQACVVLCLATAGIATLVPQSTSMVGNLGVVLCVAMFGSPLASLKTVLLTKSAESIPLPFTLASVLNCLLWSVVGVLDMKDANIYIPNLLGLSFGFIQVGLKLMYGGGSSKGYELPL
jgi:solute carrier family 50 protein (sugar transporter)